MENTDAQEREKQIRAPSERVSWNTGKKQTETPLPPPLWMWLQTGGPAVISKTPGKREAVQEKLQTRIEVDVIKSSLGQEIAGWLENLDQQERLRKSA